MHPLPARPTGRAGIETNALDRSETDFDGRSLADSSTADLAVHAAPAPYSLPAPEPPQQYYDDPAGGVYPHSGAYYDPYRGPVPPTMSPTTPNQGRPDDLYQARSPGPNGGGRAISPGPRLHIFRREGLPRLVPGNCTQRDPLHRGQTWRLGARVRRHLACMLRTEDRGWARGISNTVYDTSRTRWTVLSSLSMVEE
ncbi:hypothetical protein BS47DRAFT_1361048 [Hydnum rufescens UP504]|uniref:Uncharacterized protein n=1 Tax=Hydnum rufescens UP504 TaxID=1448309 RepID=A0A9P6B0L7_9AGAM|nr:hypothetical protein BS47DRAFT_1361048 [Hydnum rufescens UP504]